MRLILAGMPCNSRTSSFASAGVSLTPFSITYSKVMRRAFEDEGYSRQACSSSAMGHFLLIGTSTSRSSSRTPWSEIARLTCSSSPQLPILGGRWPFAERVARDHHLADDLRRKEIAHERLRARMAELAGKGAADL